MYELQHLHGNTYFFSGPTKIGLYRLNDTDVLIIDTGIEARVGKRILKTITENGWELKFIINTHAHADHVGGNAYLQGQTGCQIFANPIEACFTEYTFLNSCFVYGAFSPKELRKKFMLSEESHITPLSEAQLPEGFEIIDLKGHSSQMIGVRTPDDILFLADSLASEFTIEKYKVIYTFNVEAYLETLERVRNMKARLFVPAHADVTDDISALAEFNVKVTKDLLDTIAGFCREPISFEGLLKKIFDEFSLTMNYEQHALIGSTIKSYLSYLTDREVLKTYFEDNILMISV
ncbi:MAG: MBL fold metallo-hydrolase [Clostridia bacterium]|nr:MBL fold metallo-hydrolase [Clostridia bacterium]